MGSYINHGYNSDRVELSFAFPRVFIHQVGRARGHDPLENYNCLNYNLLDGQIIGFFVFLSALGFLDYNIPHIGLSYHPVIIKIIVQTSSPDQHSQCILWLRAYLSGSIKKLPSVFN